jgi:hypothetical protein
MTSGEEGKEEQEDEEDEKDKVAKFYSTLIDVVYGIIISTSFLVVAQVILPVDKLMNWNGITVAFGAFFAYYLVLSGWYGLHRSIVKKPFKLDTDLSKVRFGINLLIIFLEFYLVALATGLIAEGIKIDEVDWSDEDEVTQAYQILKGNYEDIFTGVLPSIYIAYIIWDLIKLAEYRDDLKDKVKRWMLLKRTISTAFIMAAFIVLSVAYSQYLLSMNSLDDNLTALFISLTLVVIYRVVLKRYSDKSP